MRTTWRESTDADRTTDRSATSKFVIATEFPWAGELYRTSSGKPRLRFTTVETFCSAFLAATGWDLPPSSPAPPESSSAARSRTSRSRVDGDSQSKQKFVVATNAPWTGEIYRTRPGLKRFRFTTFEEFVLGMLAITGWPLHPAGQRTSPQGQVHGCGL